MRLIEKAWQRYDLALLLWPLSLLFRLVAGLRRLSYRLGLSKHHSFDVPVIVVGNITVGGSGKTPLVIGLVEFLLSKGFQPGIVSRGYKGSENESVQLVTPSSKAVEVGDEAVVVAQRTQCPMAICRDRSKAVTKLLESHKVDVIISDDGLQHYALDRDIEIAVVEAERGFGNGFCLPAGPLREPKSRLRSVDFVVANGGVPEPEQYSMGITPSRFVNLADAESVEANYFIGQSLHAVAGIANPDRFYNTLSAMGLDIIRHDFPDHHNFSAKDLDFNTVRPVLMTEKDAVKCREFAQSNWWYLQVDADLDDFFYQHLLEKLTRVSKQRGLQHAF